MAVEAKRGCGFRKINGLYLVGGGLSTGCDRLPYPLDRCRTCGGGVKFTRGHTWLQPDFFSLHGAPFQGGPVDVLRECSDESPCPVCRTPVGHDFGPHLLLWIGRSHYSPAAFLEEGRKLGVSRRIPALPKGLVLGETWVLLAHLDAVPVNSSVCMVCSASEIMHKGGLLEGSTITGKVNGIPIEPHSACDKFEAPKSTADRAGRDRLDPSVYRLARRITSGEPTVDRKVRAIAVYTRSATASIERLWKTFDGLPLEAPSGAGPDADDEALAVASLCLAAGITCRIVGARFGESWTCWVEYRNDGGDWARVDPVEPPAKPDETIYMECID